jgi:signal transduction histidine kinase/DNA-binding response OmpR family regulator/ligand-binding sensor domain-containing protein
MYDGHTVQVYKPVPGNPNSLSGNLIEGVIEAEENILWIATNHGFNRLDKKRRSIEYFDEFQGKYHWAKSTDNEIFAIHEDNFLDFYDRKEKRFINIQFPGIQNDRLHKFLIDDTNIIWMLNDDGKIVRASATIQHSIPSISIIENAEFPDLYLYLFKDGDKIYLIDNKFIMFEYDVVSGKKNLIINLEKEISENGIISSVIRDKDDYLVAFQTNGLFRLKNTPEKEKKYISERIPVYCGVFSLCKDEKQDIIWIGTDGQGVYMYAQNEFSFRSFTFDIFPFRIQKPVRALLLDRFNTLWIGTKDDGIALINDFKPDGSVIIGNMRHLNTSNSSLANNAVYAFAQSARNLIWIGGDGPGLNYWSYRDSKLHKIRTLCNDNIVYVHSITEVNDTTLWLATVGNGILKVILTGKNDEPVIKSVKRFTFIKDEASFNYFFSLCRENDSILWFGNRGYGAQRLNIVNEHFQPVAFIKKGVETINDILSIHCDRQGEIWFGTSFGLSRLLGFERDSAVFENYNEIEGLPNNTIHAILEDGRNNLWLSTNNGIARFNLDSKKFLVFNRKNGLDITEFSDGASYSEPASKTMLFGGTNGFVSIEENNYHEKEFIPEIIFTGLKIYGIDFNLADFMVKNQNSDYLKLKYNQNYFALTFSALDYLNGQNARYIYRLKNFSDKWIENNSTNIASFTKIPYGEYILEVKYDNGNNEVLFEQIFSLRIIIQPPWYLSQIALTIYFLFVISSIVLIISFFRRRYLKRRDAMMDRIEQMQKEEVYESKLRFFTNITHEFCTPLTLIHGPCTKILSYSGADSFVKKYTSLILKNAERLNSLIQELIEFRRIETGNKPCRIENISISETATLITDSFADLADTKNIVYQVNIEKNLFWNTDRSCLTKILTNLISNAFKYTPKNGKIAVDISQNTDFMTISVSNTGKGIKEKDLPFVFDRYTVLENFERRTQEGLSSRNGLGLAVCHNMVKLLNGEITVKSDPDILTEFIVQLPVLENNTTEITDISPESTQIPMTSKLDISYEETADYHFVKSRPTIIVADDEPEMRWFVSEIFKDQYNVIPAESAIAVEKIMSQVLPDLIISDIMMRETDGISMMKKIKSDRRTSHIPFILLSAKSAHEEQIEGIEAGADIYITKPFQVDYLYSVVDRLLRRQDDLKDYYGSAVSSLKLFEGKFIHSEEKAFIEKALGIIDQNIKNQNFTTEDLAAGLGLSLRHLYRKMQKITSLSPADLIKEYKLSVSEKLLISTQLSIDEIMYSSGFVNRGSFYKAFSTKFGMTPKSYRKSAQI